MNEIVQNDYAILVPKKTGTTTISFENNEKVVEVTVTKVNGELKASFFLVPLVEPAEETPIDEGGREVAEEASTPL